MLLNIQNDVKNNVNMDNSTVQSLQMLGLNEREARVYLALLDLKKSGVLSIAKRAGIKRPTAYHVLESLKAKKLISSTTFRDVKDYRALPTSALKAYIRKQKKALQVELPIMQKLYETKKRKLRLRVYNRISSIKTLLEKSLREKAVIHIIGDERLFEKYIGPYWQFYLKRSAQHGISPKWKKKDDNITLLLWSDKIAFVKFEEQPQVFGFKNKQLHELYLDLWKSY